MHLKTYVFRSELGLFSVIPLIIDVELTGKSSKMQCQQLKNIWRSLALTYANFVCYLVPRLFPLLFLFIIPVKARFTAALLCDFQGVEKH